MQTEIDEWRAEQMTETMHLIKPSPKREDTPLIRPLYAAMPYYACTHASASAVSS